MCGLIGVAGVTNGKDAAIFRQMLIADYFRGKDSTGIFAVDENGELDTFKKVVDPITFTETKGYDRLIDPAIYGTQRIKSVKDKRTIWAGHNRAATAGAVTARNAHPFTCGDITLMHNGTLTKQYLLPDYARFNVDSENICHSINEIGLVDTLPKLCGAFALVWYNKAENTLNFIRNGEREFNVAFTETTMYWASEGMMLEWILNRNGIKTEEVYELPTYQHLCIDFETNKITTEDLSAHKYVAPAYNSQNRTTYSGANQNQSASSYLSRSAIALLSPHKLKIGDRIGAYVESFNKYAGNTENGYVRAVLSQKPYCKVDIHAVDGSKYNYDNYFVDGKIVSAREDKDALLIIINDAKFSGADAANDDDNVPPEVIKGYQGKELTEEEFNKFNSGCAICGNPYNFNAHLDDEQGFSWISDGEYVCYDCSETPIALEYIGRY